MSFPHCTHCTSIPIWGRVSSMVPIVSHWMCCVARNTSSWTQSVWTSNVSNSAPVIAPFQLHLGCSSVRNSCASLSRRASQLDRTMCWQSFSVATRATELLACTAVRTWMRLVKQGKSFWFLENWHGIVCVKLPYEWVKRRDVGDYLHRNCVCLHCAILFVDLPSLVYVSFSYGQEIMYMYGK